ncbi:hypothetical protein B296_00025587 [Ensete ventricosum]|uniref:Uncharacterized protein n=1 Tax=Ensete ventricosum TaxID=4639 RepID=A0A426ZIK6_ENSVE|nr:hypothetical protein B296_00025587 [Ensete ventricosum]
MLKDSRTFRQSSSAGSAPTPETNNENLPPADPFDSSSSLLESDPSRPPLLVIQEPVQNHKIGLDQGAILRGKPDATTSKNHTKGSDLPGLPLRTPERMVARQRPSMCPKSQPGVIGREYDDDSSYRGPVNQFAPLTRGGRLGLGDEHGLNTPLTSKTTAKASSVHSDCSSTQSTPTKSVIRLANYGFGKSRPPISAGTRTMSLGMTSRPTHISPIPPPVVDSVEVSHFELQEDPSFWMDNNVQLKSLESILAGALRREKMADTTIKQLKAEINQLNCLELLSESSQTDSQVCEKRIECSHEHVMKQKEDILNLQLELDILKIILAEEKSSRTEVEERANYTNNELKSANRRVLYTNKQYEDIKNELKDARSIIEKLKLENIVLVNEMKDAKKKSNQKVELVKKKEQEISLLRSQLGIPSSDVGKLSLPQEELKGIPSEYYENADFHWQMKLRKMQASLEKARDLNISFQSDQVSQTSLEQEMEEIRRQVEIETAEAIICLQEELVVLQNQADGSKRNESITKQSLMALETKLKELQIQLCLVTQENKKLGELVKEKDRELRSLTEDWERLAYEIADVLADGNTSLEEATDQVVSISDCFSQRSWIGEQVGRMIRSLSERDLVIEELQKCLEEAYNTRCDIEWKLRSLRGATIAIYEAQQQENNDKEREILRLTSEITDKMFNINQLENRIKDNDEQIKKAQLRANVVFETVNRLSEMNKAHLQEIENVKFLLDESKEGISEKDTLVNHQISLRADAEKKIQDLSTRLVQYQEHIAVLLKLSENQERAQELEQLKKEEDVMLTDMAENFPEVKRTKDEFTFMSDSSRNVDVPAEVQGSEKYTSGSAYYIAKDHHII